MPAEAGIQGAQIMNKNETGFPLSREWRLVFLIATQPLKEEGVFLAFYNFIMDGLEHIWGNSFFPLQEGLECQEIFPKDP